MPTVKDILNSKPAQGTQSPASTGGFVIPTPTLPQNATPLPSPTTTRKTSKVKGILSGVGEKIRGIFKKEPTMEFRVGENLTPEQTTVARETLAKPSGVVSSILTRGYYDKKNLERLPIGYSMRKLTDPNATKEERDEAASALSDPVLGMLGGEDAIAGNFEKIISKSTFRKLVKETDEAAMEKFLIQNKVPAQDAKVLSGPLAKAGTIDSVKNILANHTPVKASAGGGVVKNILSPKEILEQAENKAAPLGLNKPTNEVVNNKPFSQKDYDTFNNNTHYPVDWNAEYQREITQFKDSVKQKFGGNIPADVMPLVNQYEQLVQKHLRERGEMMLNSPSPSVVGRGHYNVGRTQRTLSVYEKKAQVFEATKNRIENYIYVKAKANKKVTYDALPENQKIESDIAKIDRQISGLNPTRDDFMIEKLERQKASLKRKLYRVTTPAVKLSEEGIPLALTKREKVLMALEQAKRGESFGEQTPRMPRVQDRTPREDLSMARKEQEIRTTAANNEKRLARDISAVREGPMKISIPRDQLSPELTERVIELENRRELIETSPMRPLLKYVQRRGDFAGQLPEVTGKGGKFARMGDEIGGDAMYTEGMGSEEVRAKMENYLAERKKFEADEKQLRSEINTYRENERNKIREDKGEKMMGRIANKEQKIQEKDMRLEERRRAFEEGRLRALKEAQEKAARDKAIYDAHANPPKRLNFLEKIKAKLFPAKVLNEKSKKIFMKWERDLINAKALANKEVGSLKMIPKGRAGFDIMMEYEVGKPSKYGDRIKLVFDKMFQEANARGLDVQYIENYLPHVYEESGREMSEKIAKFLLNEKKMTAEEVAAYMEGKGLSEPDARRLSLTPFFSKERVFPTYKVAMEYGLTPKYAHPDQLVAHYREQMERTLANVDLINGLRDSKQILNADDAPASWKPVELPFSQKGYYAEPALADALNGIFRELESNSFYESVVQKIAFLSRKAQEFSLSGGIPRTNINFFSMGQAIKDITAGKFSSGAAWLRANFNAPSIRYLRSNQDIIEKMAKNGIDLSDNIASYQKTYDNVVSNDNKGFAKKWYNIAGEQFDKAFNEKTFKSYLPQVQIQLFKDVYKRALRDGMTESYASKLAADTTKAFYGITEKQGRAKVTEDTLSSIFFAPKFRESIVNTLFNTAKSVTSEIKNPVFRNNRKLFAGMVLTFGLYNLLNYKLNGQFMWENPAGREAALRIPGKDGNVTYLEFMPSFLAFARNMFSGAIGLAKGDFDTAKQKFGSLFSIPVSLTTEILANKDYFGTEIYDTFDTGVEKAKKIAEYVGLDVSHPYIKELVKQLQGKKPLYQSIVAAFELPLKFSSESKESTAAYYDMLDKQKKDRDKAMDAVRPIYEKIKAVYDSGDIERGDQMADALTPEQAALYAKIVVSEKRKATIKAEREMYNRVLDLKKMYDEGKEEEADAIIDGMSEEEQRIYLLVVNKLHSNEVDQIAAEQEDMTDLSTADTSVPQ